MTAVVLIGIGYTNFSGNSGIQSNTLATSSTNNIGDVQLVSSSSAIVENEKESNSIANEVNKENNNSIVSNDENTVQTNGDIENNINKENENTVETSNSNDKQNYFSELKMERDDMYSKSLETYQMIINNSTISSEQKSIAIQEVEKINTLQNSIKVAEELIKLKGFEDVVIYSSNDKISVIVRIAALSESQVAQIQNIVSKELAVDISNITISNK